MNYLMYHNIDKLVVKISSEPLKFTDGYSICTSEQFNPGDEFKKNIYVNGVTDEGVLRHYSAVMTNPNAERLLRENQELQSEIEDLHLLLADLLVMLI